MKLLWLVSILSILCLVAAVFPFGCASDTNPGAEGPDAGADGDTDTDTDSGTECTPAETCASNGFGCSTFVDDCGVTQSCGAEDCGHADYACQANKCIYIDPCVDPDGDYICVEDDNCPDDCNRQQLDADGDGLGDVCDGDPGCGGGGGWGASEPNCEEACTPNADCTSCSCICDICPDDDQVWGCRFDTQFAADSCADFPTSAGFITEQDAIDGANGEGGATSTPICELGNSCRYERGLVSNITRCTFTDNGQPFYAYGVPSIGCTMGGGSGFIASGPICENY